MKTPTHSFYHYLDDAFGFFNRVLFEDTLPACLLTVQREKNVMGFFSANRWTDREGNLVHELAVNPTYFARHNLLEVLQTLLHEMVHNWQHSYGNPSRNGYHNRQWADKMESIGLMPSTTGLPGGNRTGQRMSDYPIPDGAFEQASKAFIRQSKGLPWVDRYAALKPACQVRNVGCVTQYAPVKPDTSKDDTENLLHIRMSELFADLVPDEQLQQAARKKVKIRYSCPQCDTHVWGKPGLNLMCGECHSPYTASSPDDTLSTPKQEAQA